MFGVVFLFCCLLVVLLFELNPREDLCFSVCMRTQLWEEKKKHYQKQQQQQKQQQSTYNWLLANPENVNFKVVLDFFLLLQS